MAHGLELDLSLAALAPGLAAEVPDGAPAGAGARRTPWLHAAAQLHTKPFAMAPPPLIANTPFHLSHLQRVGVVCSATGTRVAAMVMMLAMTGCNKGPEPQQTPAAGGPQERALELAAMAPVKVETAEVTQQKMPRSLTLTGTVLADQHSEVAANVNGLVTDVRVERGSVVKAGQILAVVDARAASLQAAAALEQSQAAQTQVSLAKQECERADRLFAQGTLSTAEHDRLKASCAGQLHQAAAAQANAQLARKFASDAVIRAPISGIVGERYINVGEFVQLPSRVASIYNINPVRVSISVPEPAVGMVKVDQTLQLDVSAWPNRTFTGTIRYVSPMLRPNTRDLVVEALVANDDGALRPGMFATSRLAVAQEEQMTVPSAAIRAEGTVKRLFLARDGKAFEMVVQTGVEKDGRMAVLETLKPGELVIVSPPPGLRDGTSIH